jgi:LacI family transcriptional regulator
MVADITNPFWTIVARGVEDALNEKGLNVILGNTDEQPSKLDNYVNVLLQRRIDGFLLTPTEGTAPIIRRIQKQHVPLVVLDRLVPEVQVDIVRGDSEGGAYQLTRYLIEAGHTRIAMLAGPLMISTSAQRIEGYKRAFSERGLPLDERLILTDSYTRDGGYRMTTQLFESVQPYPRAIFAGNNVIAWGVLNKLHELGLRIPEDVSVVSFDDLPFFSYFRPFLTVVAQSPYQLGMRSAELLMDFISGKEKAGQRDIILPVELTIRESARPIQSQIPVE